jgi:hypothetical protein
LIQRLVISVSDNSRKEMESQSQFAIMLLVRPVK